MQGSPIEKGGALGRDLPNNVTACPCRGDVVELIALPGRSYIRARLICDLLTIRGCRERKSTLDRATEMQNSLFLHSGDVGILGIFLSNKKGKDGGNTHCDVLLVEVRK